MRLAIESVAGTAWALGKPRQSLPLRKSLALMTGTVVSQLPWPPVQKNNVVSRPSRATAMNAVIEIGVPGACG
ncbi:hypothetical protein MSZK_35670 [Mycobacterium sp. shizuoka-1]|nr:hypothetical protein MSZK_35670 [Mycobacterium sp. shizuoka-1]